MFPAVGVVAGKLTAPDTLTQAVAGDIVWCPPGERHCQGAAPTTPMTHIAIAEMLDGNVVEWMEHVTDEQYGR